MILSAPWFSHIHQVPHIPAQMLLIATSILAAVSPNTLRSYIPVVKRYDQWYLSCVVTGSPFPITPWNAGLFLSGCRPSFGTASTLNTYVAALTWANGFFGFTSPLSQDKIFSNLVKGLKRIVSCPPLKKSPLSSQNILEIVGKLLQDDQCLSNLRAAVVFFLGFAGMLRSQELISLRQKDVKLFHNYAELYIAQSKMDQLRNGNTVIIAATDMEFCPFNTLTSYLAYLPTNPEAPLVQSIRVFKRNGIRTANFTGNPVSYDLVRKIIKQGVQSIGLDPKLFSTHSLRSGSATQAARNGISERLLQLSGRWKAASSKDGYVEEPVENRINFAKSLFDKS